MSDDDDFDDALYADTTETETVVTGQQHAQRPLRIPSAGPALWPKAPRRAIDTRDRHTYQVLRANFRQQCKAAAAECWLCWQSINYSLKHPDPKRSRSTTQYR